MSQFVIGLLVIVGYGASMFVGSYVYVRIAMRNTKGEE